MIEVGEYVRTQDGIKKIKKINEGRDITLHGKYRLDKPYKNSYSIAEKNILKHSKNIIDLIEVGDYVNGEKVEEINEPSLANDYNRLVYCNECEGLYKEICFNKDIKTILTKELFEANCYKVKEEIC